MSAYDPKLSHFDLDFKRGAQGEIFVDDVRKMLADGSGTIEVKTDDKFIESKRLYVEEECRGRDGIWRPSGLAVTKAHLWAFVFGEQPGMMVVETEWLRRAVVEAKQHPSNRVECKYGENPTKGTCVSINHFIKTARINS